MKLASGWTPRLADGAAPPFQRLVDALAQDIAGGALPAGERLPAHRDLAWRLGIGVGTVTKAYAILERRGLVHSVHGRGTFVAGVARAVGGTIDLSMNAPPHVLSDRLLAGSLAAVARRLNAETFSAYAEPAGRWVHRRQMARWLGHHGLQVPPERVLLTNGAQHALSVALTLACPPGTTLLTEAQTYPGALLIARQAGIRVAGLPTDAEGLRPDGLEAALRAGSGPMALYLTPTLHNPTTATMGPERRRAIAALCAAHDAAVIEDDVYGLLCEKPLPPLAALVPERTLYVTGLSKTLSPGLRIGTLAAPERLVAAAHAQLQATSTCAPALTSHIMEMWLTDGTAESIAASIRGEAARRCAVAATLLPQARRPADGCGFHLWLPMMTADAEQLVSRAAARGVVLMPARATLADANSAEAGVRICVGAVELDDLSRGLAILAGLAGEGGRAAV